MKEMIRIVKADSDFLKEKLFDLRREVFVVEQKVDARDEFDEFEDSSTHFVVLNDAEEAVGTARWRVTDKGIKLERFAVRADQRGMGVGQLLVKTVLDDILATVGAGKYLYLHAQLSAVGLYEKFGFVPEGDQFSECDILHYKMKRYS